MSKEAAGRAYYYRDGSDFARTKRREKIAIVNLFDSAMPRQGDAVSLFLEESGSWAMMSVNKVIGADPRGRGTLCTLKKMQVQDNARRATADLCCCCCDPVPPSGYCSSCGIYS